MQAFSRDVAARGARLPPEISLQDLVKGGYLMTNDVGAFQGMEVVFNTQADETHPQVILARAPAPDGTFICLLTDGSVQSLSASKYREATQNPGKTNTPRKPSFP